VKGENISGKKETRRRVKYREIEFYQGLLICKINLFLFVSFVKTLSVLYKSFIYSNGCDTKRHLIVEHRRSCLNWLSKSPSINKDCCIIFILKKILLFLSKGAFIASQSHKREYLQERGHKPKNQLGP
jgi:hypothetical protein